MPAGLGLPVGLVARLHRHAMHSRGAPIDNNMRTSFFLVRPTTDELLVVARAPGYLLADLGVIMQSMR